MTIYFFKIVTLTCNYVVLRQVTVTFIKHLPTTDNLCHRVVSNQMALQTVAMSNTHQINCFWVTTTIW